MSNHLLLTAPVMLHIYFENTATNCHPLLQISFLQEPYNGAEMNNIDNFYQGTLFMRVGCQIHLL